MQIFVSTSIILYLCLLVAAVESRISSHNKIHCGSNNASSNYYVKASREDFLRDLAEGGLEPPFNRTLINRNNCGRNLKVDFSRYPGYNCNLRLNGTADNEDDEDYDELIEETKPAYRSYIRGGSEVEPGEFPMFASMDSVDPATGKAYHCGGTLVTDNMVITAGHCVEEGWKLQVTLGHTKRDGSGQKFTGKGFCRPPNYNKNGMWNDLAVVILDRPVQRNEFVQPACLGVTRRHLGKAQCWAVGAGKASPFDESPRSVRALPVKRCKDPVKRFDRGCYASRRSKTPGSLCGGDSGGPTICIDTCRKTPRMVAVGLISVAHKKTCTDDGIYAYWTIDFFALSGLVANFVQTCVYHRAKID